jgi:hypothetical protein
MAAPVAFSVAVYCGSRPGHHPAYEAAAMEVGTWIGQHGGQLVYGGGKSGLMGAVAHSTRAAGGRVVGVIPKSMVEREWANHDCDELHVVNTMHERKQMMADRADAFVALPGGIGTFEEFFEVWAWRQLGFHDKPVGLLNTAGYYQPLMDFMAASVKAGFMNEAQMALIRSGAAAAPLLQELVQAAGLAPAARSELI